MALTNHKRDVVNYAKELGHAVSDRKLNRSAVDGLIESYVDHPRFYKSERPELIELGITTVDKVYK